jgi:aldose 1-epimerase
MKHIVFATAALLLAGFTFHGAAQTSVVKTDWGKTADGHPVEIFALSDSDLKIRITTFGARVVSIDAPDRNGVKADVVLGYKDVSQYEADKSTYFGAIVGRYGNRIAKGTYTIDGQTFHAPLNNNGNMLHGGTVGFDHKVWTGRQIPDGVEMTLVSPDGDMGFPGELTVHVRYTLKGSALHIDYTAATTKPTVVNVTNHSYFNLGGEGHGTILDEQLMLNASRYTPVDAGLIPTGQLAPVSGTPLDFRKSTAIGARIGAANEQLKLAGGYDHNFVLDGTAAGKLNLAARAVDPTSGRTLTVTTTEPGVQFYSGNFLDGTATGISGVKYVKHAGFCLETQHFPDSPNRPSFPSTVLRPGKPLHSTTVFTFGVQK